MMSVSRLHRPLPVFFLSGEERKEEEAEEDPDVYEKKGELSKEKLLVNSLWLMAGKGI